MPFPGTEQTLSCFCLLKQVHVGKSSLPFYFRADLKALVLQTVASCSKGQSKGFQFVALDTILKYKVYLKKGTIAPMLLCIHCT